MTVTTRPTQDLPAASIVRDSGQVDQSRRPTPRQQQGATPVELPRPRPLTAPVRSPLTPGVTDPRELAYERAVAVYNEAYGAWNTTHAQPYWAGVSEARTARRGVPWNQPGGGPFVDTHPPVYGGSPRPNRADFGLPPEPGRRTRTIETFTSAARQQGYGFDMAPANGTPAEEAAFETRFRERYVRAALDAGFNRDQIVGVYVFETGGDGRHTELHPNSAAIGYAQLLIANSITTTVEQAEPIAERLRARGLNAKADLVLRMRDDILAANGGRRPDWDRAGEMAGTPLGSAVHAANLDLDIGPELQMTKLITTARQFHDYSRRSGVQRELTAELLEAMNLAGPVNGFGLGLPHNRDRLTPNFFLRGGYEGNPVLSEVGPDGQRRARTAGGLMTRMSEIMHGERRNRAGSQEISRIFDRLSPPANR